MSASQIKIMEPGAVGVGMNGAPAPTGGEGERLVVITGQPANIQMAVQLLYHVSFHVMRIIYMAEICCSDLSRRNKNNCVQVPPKASIFFPCCVNQKVNESMYLV